MGVAAHLDRKSARLARLMGATALSCIAYSTILPESAFSQSIADMASQGLSDDAQMLLEADTLIYDNNDQTVTATGGVRIDYGGNRLVANQVSYDRASRRVVASGNVQIIDSQGTIVYSDTVDVTDDFGDGFVNALRVETVDKTYFAAESGERRGGFLTTFNNGVYTACEPCEDKPDKAPPWRIKAKKIIWNSNTKTVRPSDSDRNGAACRAFSSVLCSGSTVDADNATAAAASPETSPSPKWGPAVRRRLRLQPSSLFPALDDRRVRPAAPLCP